MVRRLVRRLMQGYNVKVNEEGEIILLDMELLILAPIEQDLMFLIESQEFCKTYSQKLIEMKQSHLLKEIDPLFLKYYWIHRAFMELVDCMVNLAL